LVAPRILLTPAVRAAFSRLPHDSVVHFPSDNEVLHFILLFPSARSTATTAGAEIRPAAMLSFHLFF
jgi:hypothetical protein